MDNWNGILLSVVDPGYTEYRKYPEFSDILQPYWYADTEDEHIEYLLDRADFPHGAKVLDVGCGTGATSRRMKEKRPDLDFVILNFSLLQLQDAGRQNKVCASAYDIPFRDNSFDGVMFNASLCNMKHTEALTEAERVVRPGGVLFVNDLKRVGGDNKRLESLLMCHAYRTGDIADWLTNCDLCFHEEPSVGRDYLREIWGDGYTYDVAFYGVVPGIWRFTKKGEVI